jgi:iron complex outermembrane recepter protein
VKLNKLAQAVSLICIVSPALAQVAPVTADAGKPQKLEKVEVTGSSIKRVQDEGSLPIQVITREEIERRGIVSAEQLIASLDSNGNGLDNLASNADVVAGQARGNNGSSAANLRGQGAAATLILLNGRRIAAHGLNGGVVDLNSIPFAAVERVEVLKDGASAIYGTDAIGGVINFILRKNFKGLTLQAFTDTTEHKGGNIFRLSAVGGVGDLDKDGYNVMISLARSQNQELKGNQRSFVNTFQPDRGLSVDTRGAPFATAFAIGSVRTILSSRTTPTSAITNNLGPIQPGTTVRMNGINALDLPGQPGCTAIDGMSAYDEILWATPAAKWGCAWDTGRAAAIQQPVTSSNLVSRANFKFGDHLAYAEVTASQVESRKSFSNQQISSSTSSTNPYFNLVYPSTAPGYNYVFNSIVALFPSIEENRGQGIAYRWRCIDCGRREIETDTETARLLIGAEGPIGTWDYRVGLSQAYSDSRSTLGGGYFFNDLLRPALLSGEINPFLRPGETQTARALALLEGASARGTKLYGGKFTLSQVDASVSGPVFKMPAGDMMAAVGTDIRTEKYKFQGDERDLATQRAIFNAPFDNINALGGVKRDIVAVYAEVLIPILKSLDVTVAGRSDRYTGFGRSNNPKVSFRFSPIEQFLLRGSYNTGFRVPTFNQLFNGITESPYSGKDLVDPAKCPTLIVSATPGCESITPNTLFGGKRDLGPEKTKQGTFGVVLSPLKNLLANIDWWRIQRTGTIQTLSLTDLVQNSALFPANFIRDSSGTLVAIDERWVNAGETITSGVDLGARYDGKLGDGRYTASIDGTYLLTKKSRLLVNAPFGASEIGTFTRSGDLGLRWKHTAAFTYRQGDWSTTLTQSYRSGYKDAVLPGVENGSVVPSQYNPKVKNYTLYNLSATYSGVKNMKFTGGIKNLFDKDPPFSAAYDSDTGAGSSWEPRVADPRLRSYTLLVSYDF